MILNNFLRLRMRPPPIPNEPLDGVYLRVGAGIFWVIIDCVLIDSVQFNRYGSPSYCGFIFHICLLL